MVNPRSALYQKAAVRRAIRVVVMLGAAGTVVAAAAVTSRNFSTSQALAVATQPGATSSTTVTTITSVVVPKATTSTSTQPMTTSLSGPTKTFCAAVRTELDQVRQLSISLTDPARLQSLASAVAATAAQSGGAAPPSATADLGVLAKAVADVKSGLDQAGYDLAKLPPDLVTRLQSPDFVAAREEHWNRIRR